ncbi:hypothetical protein [Bacillus cereus]|nr:hypothetical protein [Bacillus cereus]
MAYYSPLINGLTNILFTKEYLLNQGAILLKGTVTIQIKEV